MRRLGLLLFTGLLGLFCCAVFAQQFRISQYDGESLTIEYPPCFDGAYLFVEKNTNLLSGVWEVLDYMQVDLVAEAPAMYYPPVTNAPDGTSGSQEKIPCVMTSEYIEALANGEIENDQWSADSVWNATQDGVKGFFRIFGLSFEDSDGDGVDNVTEYGRGTNPYTNDAPAVTLPPDHGDPKPVPGSVNSTQGDWNSSPENIYRNTGTSWQTINALTLALDGTNGSFTAQTPIADLSAWVEAQCGTWVAAADEELYPAVSGGRFYRTPENGFSWAGRENVFPLALHPYDGSEAFVNSNSHYGLKS